MDDFEHIFGGGAAFAAAAAVAAATDLLGLLAPADDGHQLRRLGRVRGWDGALKHVGQQEVVRRFVGKWSPV